MSVLYVKRVVDGTTHSETVGGEITLTDIYKIRLDAPLSTSAIKQHPEVPAPWSPHPNDSRALAQSFEWEWETPLLTTLSITYSSVDQSGGLGNNAKEYTPEQQANPFLRPAKISWGPAQFRKQVTEMTLLNGPGANASPKTSTAWSPSISGKIPISTSAGEPFFSSTEVDDCRLHITIEKNVPAPQAWFFSLMNKVNDAAFIIDGLSGPAGTLKIASVGCGDVQFENDITYRILKIEIQHREEGWDFRFQDKGFEEVDDAINSSAIKGRKKIYDTGGLPIQSAVLLDGNGKRLTSGAPAYVYYRHYDRISYSVLNPYLT